MKTIMLPLSSRDVEEFYANGVGAVEGGSGGDGAGDWTNANDACGGRCFQRSTNPTNHPTEDAHVTRSIVAVRTGIRS